MGEKFSVDKIANCIIELIEEQGLKFTVDDVALRLGISKRTIYKYYNSKTEMLECAVDAIWDDMQKQNFKVLALEGVSLADKLVAMMQIYPSNIKFDNISLDNIMEFSPKIYERIMSHMVNHWEIPFELLDKCIEQGEITPISHECFKIIMTGIFETSIQYDNHKELVEECVRQVFNGLRVNK